MGVRFAGGDTAMAAGHLAGGQQRADMRQELLRYEYGPPRRVKRKAVGK
jgi:hypothetical protein